MTRINDLSNNGSNNASNNGSNGMSNAAKAVGPVRIGVDVCKKHLDVYARPTGERHRFANDDVGIEQLVVWAKTLGPVRVVFESTGHYQNRAVAALLGAKLPTVVVNARQVRDFAKGLGKQAKTDRIDAAVLAHFAEVVNTVVKPLPTREAAELTALFDRRSQLVRMLAAEKNHRHAAENGPVDVRRNIEKTMRHLESQIKVLEKRMDRIVRESAEFQERDAILQSIVGVGPQVSRTLLTCLPELGQATRTEIAALAGLAPYADDSGLSTGPRHIRGGRSKVRIGLYQAAVSAVRHSAEMGAFFTSLKERGKATKVALVAVARKLLVLANALMRDGKRYDAARSRANSPETAPANATPTTTEPANSVCR